MPINKSVVFFLPIQIAFNGNMGNVPLASVQHLESNFGKSFGRMLFEYSHGIDQSPVVPFYEPSSFSREVTFQEDTRDLYLIKETLFELAKGVVDGMKYDAYKAKTVTIKIRYKDFHTITRAKSVQELSDSFNDIWAAALEVFNKIDFPKEIRLAGVKVSGLVKG